MVTTLELKILHTLLCGLDVRLKIEISQNRDISVCSLLIINCCCFS